MERDIIELARAVAGELVQQLAAADRRRQQGTASEVFAAEIAAALDEAMDRLGRTNLWGPANRMASNEFWRVARPLLEHGELQVRARTKPRGYAGDFELLDRICHCISCRHPLGSALDQYFLSEAAPRAVRHRTELVAQRLVARCQRWPTRPLRVVSVGSGPAVELQMAAERLSPTDRERLRFTLLDLDQQALDHANERLLPFAVGACECLRVNLSRLPSNDKLAAAIAPADFLFCAGFFDYLDDEAAVEMLNLFIRSLAPDGALTVFNFSPANSSRAYMEWIGNWYLTYRDETAMSQLAERVDANGHVVVRSVSRGTLVELTIGRTAGAVDLLKTGDEPSGPV